ncbi:S8 family peptidase [bacterium]|nr:S8 family peptidase [bacterium]
MDRSEYLPIQVILPLEQRDYKPKRGGGPSERRIFNGGFTKEREELLLDKVDSVSNHFKSSFAKYPNVPAVAYLQLHEDALAKSHRRNTILGLKSCPVIGSDGLGRLLLSATKAGLNKLRRLIVNNESKDNLAFLSAIDDFGAYTKNDVLQQFSVDNELGIYKARLFNHKDDLVTGAIESAFRNEAKLLGLEEPKKINYCKHLQVYRISSTKADTITSLAEFVGIRKVDALPRLRLIRSSGIIKHKWNVDIWPQRDTGFNYPNVGIVDGGIDLNDPVLDPWVVGRDKRVPDAYCNYYHASFVGSLVVAARQMNSNNPYFPETPCSLFDLTILSEKQHCSEDDLVSAIEHAVKQHHETIKVWNLSFQMTAPCSNDCFSDFAVALDDIADEYDVQFVIAAGNMLPDLGEKLRPWPPNDGYREMKICPPADSARGLCVGAIAHCEKSNSLVKMFDPSPFSRSGPAPSFLPKPEISLPGGNTDNNGDCSQLGVLGYDGSGNIVEDIGTSFAAPLASNLIANLRECIVPTPSWLMCKALLIHAGFLKHPAKQFSEFKHRGWGVPPSLETILSCEPWMITMLFNLKIPTKNEFLKADFPIPESLRTSDGRIRGEYIYTLVSKPQLDQDFGPEYLRTDLSITIGSGKEDVDGEELRYTTKGDLQPRPRAHNKFEKELIKKYFKWSPVKVGRAAFPKGVTAEDLRLHVNVIQRGEYEIDEEQEAALVVSIIDPKRELPIYNDAIRALRSSSWNNSELKIRDRWKIRL